MSLTLQAATPLEEARVLLRAASEVEHALLVEYLYVAWSVATAQRAIQIRPSNELSETLMCQMLAHVPCPCIPRARVTCARIPVGKRKADRRIDVSVCQHSSAESSIHNVKLPPPAQTRFVGRPVLHPLNDIFGMW